MKFIRNIMIILTLTPIFIFALFAGIFLGVIL